MRVHLPSGRVVEVPASLAGSKPNLADFCPKREEHTTPGDRRRYVATVHAPCGLAVVYVRKPRRG